MFAHNFKYAFKTLIKNKPLIFWTFAFPVIMATFFNMAFSNITKSEKLDIINIAIVTDKEWNNEVYKEAFKKLSDEDNENRLFETKYVSEKEAKELLADEKIDGYLQIVDGRGVVTVNNSGINQTILKSVTEEIEETSTIIENIAKQEITNQVLKGNTEINYEEIYSKAALIAQTEYANIKDDSKNKIDYVMIEFYTLIAMTCLYGGMLSIAVINNNLPNMGNIGKRVSIAPTKKGITILSSLGASYLTQLIGLLILFIYTIFILKIDYGDNLGLIILLSCIGSLAGLSTGLAVGAILKISEAAKTGIIITISMVGSFLAGMMGITMKYIIDSNIPFLNKINPVNMITDGFYSLYYYDTLNRFWFNIISLSIYSLILIILAIISLRRQKYDSI